MVRKLWRWLGTSRLAGLVLLAALMALRIADPAPLQSLRFLAFDLYQQVRPRAPAEVPVSIVDIDDASLAELGQWPWPRTWLARILDAAAADGAAAVAIDILLAEPDRMSPASLADAVPHLPADLARRLTDMPSHDEVLAQAMARLPVVVGQTSTRTGRAAAPQGTAGAPVPHAYLGPDPTPYLLDFPELVGNLPVFETAAAGRGVISVRPDRDGIYRRVPLAMRIGGQLRLSLTPELLRVATGGDAFAIRTGDAGIEEIVLAGHAVRTDANALVWPHFAPPDPGRFVSAADLALGRMPPGRLTGHLVYIGTSAIGLEDYRPTPLGVPMAGVEIHAQVLENILTGSLLFRPGFAIGAELVTVALLGGATILLVPILGATAIVAAALVSLAGYLAFSFWLFAARASLLDPAFPSLALILTVMLMTITNYLREERRRRQIRTAFGQYVSPALVERLQARPEALRLGGETRELTVLFTDVRSFTAMAEGHRDRPEALTQTMNALLTALSEAVLDEAGTIDKFMGDSLMAFWNAPVDRADHEAAAARAALKMQENVARLNRAREAAGASPLDVGIGINSGPAIVGNMGSALRFDYTALGDTVNLASRLEGQSARYGVGIVLGESTARALGPEFAVVELDLVRVVGKSEPERAFALLGDTGAAGAPFAELQEAVRAMLAAYRAGDWDTAETGLPRIHAAARASNIALDPYLALYRTRLARMRTDPPGADWDGAETALSK